MATVSIKPAKPTEPTEAEVAELQAALNAAEAEGGGTVEWFGPMPGGKQPMTVAEWKAMGGTPPAHSKPTDMVRRFVPAVILPPDDSGVTLNIRPASG